MNGWINLHALWQILVFGLLAGAGLPALFAVGLRFLGMTPSGQPQPAGPGPAGRPAAVAADGRAGAAQADGIVGGSPLGMVLAGICFAIVLAAIGWGIYFIVLSSH